MTREGKRGGLYTTTGGVTLLAAGQDLDVFVGLSDGANSAVVRLGLVAVAPYPDAFRAPLSVLRTGRLPGDAFTATNPDLDPSTIRQVRVPTLAKATGHLLMDSIEFLP